jgi:hypothetical protein
LPVLICTNGQLFAEQKVRDMKRPEQSGLMLHRSRQLLVRQRTTRLASILAARSTGPVSR